MKKIFILLLLFSSFAQAQFPIHNSNRSERNLSKMDKSNRTYIWDINPDSLPVFSYQHDSCSRSTYNLCAVRTNHGILSEVAGTDTSVVKRTIGGKDYVMFSLDSSQNCNVHRSELTFRAWQNFLSDSIFWIGEVKLIPKSWTVDSTFVGISQLHGGSSHLRNANVPPYALLVKNDSLFATVAYNTAPDSTKANEHVVSRMHYLCKVPFGKPFSYVCQIKYATYPRKGFVKVWIDDKLLLDYEGSVGYVWEDRPYYNVGIYKWLFCTGKNCTVAPSVESAKIKYYMAEARYGNGNSTYADIRPSYTYTGAVAHVNK